MADKGGSLIEAIPPEYRIYRLLFLLLTVVLVCVLVIVRTSRSPLIAGEIRLHDQFLSFPVRGGNRTERISWGFGRWPSSRTTKNRCGSPPPARKVRFLAGGI